MQVRLFWRDLPDRESRYRLGGIEPASVIQRHERDLFLLGHAPADRELGQPLRSAWAELKAVRHCGFSDLIQQVAYLPGVSIDCFHPHAVQRWCRHPRHATEPTTSGANPAALECGHQMPPCFKERASSNRRIDSHGPDSRSAGECFFEV